MNLDEKLALLLLRMVFSLHLLFLLLYNPAFEDGIHATQLIPLPAYFASNLALSLIPAERFKQSLFQTAVFLCDMGMISWMMYVVGDVSTNFYLICFLVIFMSGIHAKLGHSFLIGTMAGLLYIALWLKTADTPSLVDTPMLLRLSFFYSVSFLSALFASQLKTTDASVEEMDAMITVYKASQAVCAYNRLEELFPVIVDLCKNLLTPDDVSIMLKADDGKLKVAVTSLPRNSPGWDIGAILAERAAESMFLWNKPVVILSRLANDQRFSDLPALRNINSAMVYPLRVEGKVLGAISVNRSTRQEQYTDREARLLAIIGAQIAQTIYNAKLHEQLESNLQELKKACRQLEDSQASLVESEKLAAIGQLAAGVAHELNNPLTGILCFSQILLQNEELPRQQKEDLEGIYKQSQRCRQIINNLLSFSRKKSIQKLPVHIPELLEETLQLVRYEFASSGIEIIKKIVPPESLVLGDRGQLQQVFLNLIMNAKHALEGKNNGKLEIDASQETSKLRVHFRDNGCGIPRNNLSKVFDPFFTTKPAGKGTGLGLSISYGIIRQHGGAIVMESEEGCGSTFTVELPA